MLTPVDLSRFWRWRPYSWSTAPFRIRPWSELLDRYWELSELRVEELATVEIIESVISRGSTARLGGNFTIDGLHVVDLGDCTPPYWVAGVRLAEADVQRPPCGRARLCSIWLVMLSPGHRRYWGSDRGGSVASGSITGAR